MKPHRVMRSAVRAEELAGTVLARDVGGREGRKFAKGHVIREVDIPALLDLDWEELHVLEVEPGELHEVEAGERLARAVAGEGTVAGAMAGGHCPIRAERRGILHVEVERLARLNDVEGACVYTLYDGQIVDPDEVVARAKITPFVIDAAHLAAAERIACEGGGVVRVSAFRPLTVAAVVQETLGEGAAARFRATLGEKIAWFGARLLEPAFVAPAAEAVASAIEELAGRRAEVIVLAGTKAMDPLDPAFLALDRLGVRLERYGVPAHPGSLFWIARYRDIPLLGMPSCGLFSQATVFDLVLPRVLAGERVGREELARLGHGGLLGRESAFRFPRYRATSGRGEIP